MTITNKSLVAAIALLGSLGVCSTAFAQYKLQAWYNFEDGSIPSQLVPGHYAGPDSLRLGIWRTLTDVPALTQGVAATEVGAAGLVFSPGSGKPQVSLIANTSMDRSRLQPGWKAVYQADFFLDEPGKPSPTTALLAITPKEGLKFGYSFYRFGVLEGGEQIFFSFANQTPEPVLYNSQPLSSYNLQRPGWHRFQIIFEGPDQIAFAIDTIPTSFSPIIEPTLTMMHPGLMVTTQKPEAKTYVDNLSIQWTMEAGAPLPDSPWSSALATDVAAAPNGAATSSSAAPIYDADTMLNWFDDHNAAVQAALVQGKPMLALFYAPKIAPYTYLKGITPAGASTEDLFNKFVLLKVDANQLAGGKTAGDFRVLRLPTFVVIGANSQEKGRVEVMNNQTTWESISSQLTTLAQ